MANAGVGEFGFILRRREAFPARDESSFLQDREQLARRFQ